MTKKKQQNKKHKKQQQSVVSEAWENMNEDMARVLPSFISNRLQGGKKKLWVVVAVTIVELIVLGTIGKLLYDWLVS